MSATSDIRARLAAATGSWANLSTESRDWLTSTSGARADMETLLAEVDRLQGKVRRYALDEMSQIAAEHDLYSLTGGETVDEYRGRVLADAEANGRIVRLTGPSSVANPTPSTKCEWCGVTSGPVIA